MPHSTTALLASVQRRVHRLELLRQTITSALELLISHICKVHVMRHAHAVHLPSLLLLREHRLVISQRLHVFRIGRRSRPCNGLTCILCLLCLHGHLARTGSLLLLLPLSLHDHLHGRRQAAHHLLWDILQAIILLHKPLQSVLRLSQLRLLLLLPLRLLLRRQLLPLIRVPSLPLTLLRVSMPHLRSGMHASRVRTASLTRVVPLGLQHPLLHRLLLLLLLKQVSPLCKSLLRLRVAAILLRLLSNSLSTRDHYLLLTGSVLLLLNLLNLLWRHVYLVLARRAGVHASDLICHLLLSSLQHSELLWCHGGLARRRHGHRGHVHVGGRRCARRGACMRYARRLVHLPVRHGGHVGSALCHLWCRIPTRVCLLTGLSGHGDIGVWHSRRGWSRWTAGLLAGGGGHGKAVLSDHG